jgi:hypothetical protein
VSVYARQILSEVIRHHRGQLPEAVTTLIMALVAAGKLINQYSGRTDEEFAREVEKSVRYILKLPMRGDAPSDKGNPDAS